MHCACQRMTVLDLAYEGHNIIKTGELEYSRLRGSSRTSTLGGCLWTASAPDADNAAVGSHNAAYGFLQETPQRASPVFC